MAAGADVIYQNVDAAAIGVFQAVQARNNSGKTTYAFGCNSNQNAVAPDVILGSVVMDIPRAYLDLVKEAAAGKLAGGPAKLGLKGGYVDLVLNDKHPAVTAELKAAVDELRKKLVEQKVIRAPDQFPFVHAPKWACPAQGSDYPDTIHAQPASPPTRIHKRPGRREKTCGNRCPVPSRTSNANTSPPSDTVPSPCL